MENTIEIVNQELEYLAGGISSRRAEVERYKLRMEEAEKDLARVEARYTGLTAELKLLENFKI